MSRSAASIPRRVTIFWRRSFQNYDPDATVIISTHLIADIERTLDEFIFINNGNIVMYDSVDAAREKNGKTIDELFREVFRC